MGLLNGKELKVTITMDRPEGPYAPGDRMRTIITIVAPEGGKVREARAGLVLWQHTKTTTRDGGSVAIQESTNENWVQKEPLLQEQDLPANFTQTFTFDWSIPADALPGAVEGDSRRRVIVKVDVDRPLAKDVHEELEVPVIANNGSN